MTTTCHALGLPLFLLSIQVNPPTFLTIPTIYEARQVGLDFLFSACSEAKLRFPFATFISIL